jgi:uncharacterized SAM-binding protein YcdF (DUF218 family)
MKEEMSRLDRYMNITAVIFLLIGVFSLVYFVAILLYSGTGTAFLWFWVMAGIGSLTLSVFLRLLSIHKLEIHRNIRNGLGILFLIGLTVFLLVEGIIISNGRQQPDPGADYIIVLGAQVRGTALSRALKSRLDTACEYLVNNEKTMVIVSGGQGSGEDISEAEAMSCYLISKGIDEKGIIKEDKSTNTFENINFSKKYLEEGKSHIVLVTNRFHVFRATSIAKKQGLTNVQGLGAPNDDILTLHHYVREFFAVIKDKLISNI